MESKKTITSYLKKAALAHVDKVINFKEGDGFYKISKDEFLKGEVNPNTTLKIFTDNKKYMSEKDSIYESLRIIIVAKVIKIVQEGSQKKDETIEDLTGIFYVPALINREQSYLFPLIEDNKLPWFPREYLKPMIEPELAIGNNDLFEETLSNELNELYNISNVNSWNDYLKFLIKLYENTTNCKFEDDYIYNLNGLKNKIELEKNMYIFVDTTFNSIRGIKNLYEDILNQKLDMPLYENFIKLEEEKDFLLEKNSVKNRQMHMGQMNGEYGLSESQRESINHFNNQNDGEILAIQGPPGTGKTTLIQSIVANEFVKRALKEEDPPIIVASSTNNQAVTNIIESFGKIKKQYSASSFESRWIEKVNSFAVYFPSERKIREAKEKGFQYTDNRGNNFVSVIEEEVNKENSKEKFLEETKKMFNFTSSPDISFCKNAIHERLVKLNNFKDELINIVEQFNEFEFDNIDEFLLSQKNLIKSIQQERANIQSRIEFWRNKYKDIPFLWKTLSFSNKYKLKISNRLKTYLIENENFENDIINIDYIELYYNKIIEEKNKIIRQKQKIIETIENGKVKYLQILNELENWGMLEDICLKTNKDELDEWIDKNIRYISFWLSVHYYEARWLEGENILTEKQKGTTFNNVLVSFYKRLALVTPCMVMTFYKLSKQFEKWDNEKYGFLYNFIDLLIVDEAGQVSPEIAACSFSLAKKALIVGDEHQIEPVWSVTKPLDKSLALQEKVIFSEDEFEILQRTGLNSSSSSVMNVACNSCKYRKFEDKGLFLSEHRRCFDTIIKYCNDLVYKGNLKPLRGNKRKDNKKDLFPKMGYVKVECEHSQRVGTSRQNYNEADKIANWINENYDKIIEYYSDDKIKPENLIGVITPFKAQANLIKISLARILDNDICSKITVGTIHTFQGGERKIILMSTTYGKNDNCFFIDNNKSLMNVAVSRAEDSFIVFGNVECFKDEKTSPSGLLKSFIVN